MFRHERPQKGRYRQFHQFGAETFGFSAADIEAELILLAARFWRMLGLDGIELEINSLGSSDCRARYRNLLVSYFSDHETDLDEDSKRRLQTNPLRILDSKHPDMQTLIAAAPALADSLDSEAAEHFTELQDILDQCDLPYRINPRLVRGLDYYSHTVFEWVTESLGAQGTVCAGGRYDGLLDQLGGRQGYAAGYAMGCERLIAMMIDQQRVEQIQACDVYLVNRGSNSAAAAYRLSEQLRDAVPELNIVVNAGSGSIKSQMKRADRSGAPIALILAETEIENDQVSVKFLREARDQQQVSQQELPGLIRQWLE